MHEQGVEADIKSILQNSRTMISQNQVNYGYDNKKMFSAAESRMNGLRSSPILKNLTFRLSLKLCCLILLTMFKIRRYIKFNF